MQHLKSMDVNQYRSSKEIIALANQFGWTESNPTNFSKVKVIEVTLPMEIQRLTFFECPECHYAFDTLTGDSYNSLSEVREEMRNRINEALGTDIE